MSLLQKIIRNKKKYVYDMKKETPKQNQFQSDKINEEMRDKV